MENPRPDIDRFWTNVRRRCSNQIIISESEVCAAAPSSRNVARVKEPHQTEFEEVNVKSRLKNVSPNRPASHRLDRNHLLRVSEKSWNFRPLQSWNHRRSPASFIEDENYSTEIVRDRGSTQYQTSDFEIEGLS